MTRDNRLIPLGLAAVVSMLAACTEQQPAPDETQPAGAPIAGEEATSHTSEVAVHMGEHFWELADAHDAAIEGNLDGIREATRWLADHDPVEGLPEAGLPYVAALRAESARTAEAANLAEAATGLSRVAASCGACHQALEVPLPTVVDQDPPGGDDLGSQMSTHIRAADLMWEALIAPSEDAWQSGIALLSSVDVLPSAVTDTPEEEQVVSDLLDRVRAVAEAGGATDAGERPALYGQLVATCGQCHSALGRGFDPDPGA